MNISNDEDNFYGTWLSHLMSSLGYQEPNMVADVLDYIEYSIPKI